MAEEIDTPSPQTRVELPSIDALHLSLEKLLYFADRGLETAVFLSLQLGKPLLVEGETGVGKTELARVLAGVLEGRLIRLQCYEGLDVSSALFEWNYYRQLLHLQMVKSREREPAEEDLFDRRFLLARPLLRALEEGSAETPVVLLIDELDRADEEFEAFLLEMLSEFEITVPELGTIRAVHRPHVLITSNRSRDLSDALRRRCLYHWIEYPSYTRELKIVRHKHPEIRAGLARQVTAFVQEMRSMELFKTPGVAETLDWTAALVALDRKELTREVVEDTIGLVLKYQDDVHALRGESLRSVLERARVRARGERAEG